MEIKPTRKNVLIAECAAKQSTDSGIILSGGLETKRGKVLAVGPEATEVKEGDEVYLNWNKGKPVTVDGKQRIIINEEEIVLVYEN